MPDSPVATTPSLSPHLRLYAARLLPAMLPKHTLQEGEYYVGMCRNATVARWDGHQFHHWRRKFEAEFVETIKHPDDDAVFDCFVPVAHTTVAEVRAIPWAKD